MRNFKELNLIILRMRMNFSCYNTTYAEFCILGGSMHKNPKYKCYFSVGKMVSEKFIWFFKMLLRTRYKSDIEDFNILLES